MYLTKNEYNSVFAAIDFITSNSDGADEDQYPHDILDGLRSVVGKYKMENHKRLVKQQLKKISKKLNRP